MEKGKKEKTTYKEQTTLNRKKRQQRGKGHPEINDNIGENKVFYKLKELKRNLKKYKRYQITKQHRIDGKVERTKKIFK